MKKDTHPTYCKDAQVTCSCGAQFTLGSTMESIRVEICSNCHPMYTGKSKVMDSAGRVDKFKERMSKMAPKENK